MNDIPQDTMVTLIVKDCIMRPRTITSLMYKLIASEAKTATVTSKKY